MSRCCTDVRAFALFPDETQVLDGTSAGGPEPVRGARGGLRGPPGLEDEVVFPEYKAERSVEDIDPVVTLVGAQVGFGVVASGREDELVGLDSSGPTGQRQDDRAVAAGDGTQIDAGVAGRRRIDELVERDPVGASKRKQLLERGTSQARPEPGQGAGGGAGGGGASTSSASVPREARASGSSCSSVGRRRPASSRDKVLVEMPVSSARSASVTSRCSRRRFNLGPTASRVRSMASATLPFCHSATTFAHPPSLSAP